MRILMITQWFKPELSLVLGLAKGLRECGHDVSILTGFPNYPGGKLYPGYRIRVSQKEVIDGLPVLRVPLYPSHDSSVVRRIINYGSFALSSSTIGLALSKKPDVIYVYHPPATIGLPAFMFKWLKNTPFIYHIQDLWPDSIAATGMFDNKMGLYLMEKWCQLIYKQASKIVVISPGFKRILQERGVPEKKIEVVYNWCHDENEIKPKIKDETLAQKLRLAGRFNIVFAGNMGKAQAIDAILTTASLIKEKLQNIQFVFVGGGVDVVRLKNRANAENINNVLFLPLQPASEVSRILALADAVLVHLRDDPLFSITIPGKTQAYMAAEKPILMGVRGDAAELVEKAQAGITFIPENPVSCIAAIEIMYKMPRNDLQMLGRNGLNYYKNHLASNIAVKRFDEIFQNL